MELLPEQLRPLVNCPVCNKKYREMKMLVLAEEEKRTTLHVTCSHCRASALVFVSLTQFGAMSFGTLSDLDQSEAKHFYESEPISSDQVLEIHQFLKRYRGGVEAIIS